MSAVVVGVYGTLLLPGLLPIPTSSVCTLLGLHLHSLSPPCWATASMIASSFTCVTLLAVFPGVTLLSHTTFCAVA